ncbi:unnamed protein product [Prunus armeniaca]
MSWAKFGIQSQERQGQGFPEYSYRKPEQGWEAGTRMVSSYSAPDLPVVICTGDAMYAMCIGSKTRAWFIFGSSPL